MTATLLNYCFLLIISVFIFLPIIRDNNKHHHIVISLLLLSALHLLSLYNALIDFLPGANQDAYTFWRNASKAAEHNEQPPFYLGMQAYIVLLYWQIKATANSLPVIQLFSLIISALNVLVITRLFLMLGGQRSMVWVVILLLCLSPSFLSHSVITLREPLQLLSILLFIYLTLRFQTLWGVYISAFSLVLATILHQALLIFSLLIVVLYSFVFIYIRRKNNYHFLIDLSILTSALYVFGPYFNDYVPILSNNTLADLNRQGIIEHLLAYRHPIEQSIANTAHNFTLSFDTFSASVHSIVVNYLYYLFGPIINYRFTLDHTVLLWETLIRGFGVSLMLAALFRERDKQVHFLLAVFYILMTLLWSLGTANDGQAFRHHVLSQWVIYIYIGWFIQRRLVNRNRQTE